QAHWTFPLETQLNYTMSAALLCGRRTCSWRLPAHEDGGTFDRVVLQLIQGLMGIAQRKPLHLSVDGDLRGDTQEVYSVLARIVSHTANHPLLIEQAVIQRWNRAHVNPAQGQRSALLQRFERCGHDLTRGRENDRRVKL